MENSAYPTLKSIRGVSVSDELVTGEMRMGGDCELRFGGALVPDLFG